MADPRHYVAQHSCDWWAGGSYWWSVWLFCRWSATTSQPGQPRSQLALFVLGFSLALRTRRGGSSERSKIAVLSFIAFVVHGHERTRLTSSVKDNLVPEAGKPLHSYLPAEASGTGFEQSGCYLIADLSGPRFHVVKAVVTHRGTPTLPPPRVSLRFSRCGHQLAKRSPPHSLSLTKNN